MSLQTLGAVDAIRTRAGDRDAGRYATANGRRFTEEATVEFTGEQVSTAQHETGGRRPRFCCW